MSLMWSGIWIWRDKREAVRVWIWRDGRAERERLIVVGRAWNVSFVACGSLCDCWVRWESRPVMEIGFDDDDVMKRKRRRVVVVVMAAAVIFSGGFRG